MKKTKPQDLVGFEALVNERGVTLSEFSRYCGVSFYILKRINHGFPGTRIASLSRVRRALDQFLKLTEDNYDYQQNNRTRQGSGSTD